MAVVLGHKVLDLAGRGILQPVAPYEVVGDVVLLGVGGLAVNSHRPAVGAVLRCHGCGCDVCVSCV